MRAKLWNRVMTVSAKPNFQIVGKREAINTTFSLPVAALTNLNALFFQGSTIRLRPRMIHRNCSRASGERHHYEAGFDF